MTSFAAVVMGALLVGATPDQPATRGGTIDLGQSGLSVMGLPALEVLTAQSDLAALAERMGLDQAAGQRLAEALRPALADAPRVAAIFSQPTPLCLLAAKGSATLNEPAGRIEVPIIYEMLGSATPGQPSPLRLYYLLVPLPAADTPVVLRLETVVPAIGADGGIKGIGLAPAEPVPPTIPPPGEPGVAGGQAPGGGGEPPAIDPAAWRRTGIGVAKRLPSGWRIFVTVPGSATPMRLRVVGAWAERMDPYAGKHVHYTGTVTMTGPDKGEIDLTSLEILPGGPGPAGRDRGPGRRRAGMAEPGTADAKVVVTPGPRETIVVGRVVRTTGGLRLLVGVTQYHVIGPLAGRLPSYLGQWVTVTGAVGRVMRTHRITATKIAATGAPKPIVISLPGVKVRAVVEPVSPEPSTRTLKGVVRRSGAGFVLTVREDGKDVIYTLIGGKGFGRWVGKPATVSGAVTRTGPATGTIRVTTAGGPAARRARPR